MANPNPKPGPGRPKGVKNKITIEIKQAILNAFTEVGGENYLVSVAKSDPRTFCTLLGKIMPTQITGEDGGAVKVEGRNTIDVSDWPADKRAALRQLLVGNAKNTERG